jgi:CheY-like chemotaxis protein
MQKPNRDILKGWDVLVIDDDPKSLDVASRILAHYGATVHQAVNGQEGLEKVETVRPKFIISDLSMPVMDGWVFISRMQADRGLATIPAIALTAHAMVGDRERAMASGFHNYLSKPLSPATFITDLLRLLVDIPELEALLDSQQETEG